MSDEVVLKVGNVGKRYELYSAPHHRLFQTLFRGRKQFYKEFWALKNVSFEVKKGECFGIIGRNGSGKSTLLQIVAGILAPSLGSVQSNGRVSALLELGSGFNPEFTGRENVYMNGAIMGFLKAEMDKKFDAIAAFADIGEFIDQPVKIYSSGMYVRLAFAVAISVDPDILIVDEALSVGDARFQSRCMNRINKFRESGVSILFVSHDTETVKRICNKSLVLDQGEIVNQGAAGHMSNWYLAFLTNDCNLEKTRQMEMESVAKKEEALSAQPSKKTFELSAQSSVLSRPEKKADCAIDRAQHPEFAYFRHGDGNARIIFFSLCDEKGRHVEHVFLGMKIYCHIEIVFNIDLPYHIIGLHIRDGRGTDIVAINTFQERLKIPSVTAGEHLTYTFCIPIELRSGNYSITTTVAYHQYKMEWMDWIDNIVIFQVVDPDPNRLIFGVYYPRDVSVFLNS